MQIVVYQYIIKIKWKSNGYVIVLLTIRANTGQYISLVLRKMCLNTLCSKIKTHLTKNKIFIYQNQIIILGFIQYSSLYNNKYVIQCKDSYQFFIVHKWKIYYAITKKGKKYTNIYLHNVLMKIKFFEIHSCDFIFFS